MKDTLKGLGSLLLGLGILIGTAILIVFFVKGGLWLSELLYPVLLTVFSFTLIVSIVILLPLGFIRPTRPFAGFGLFIASYVFGATVWTWAFLLTYELWGGFALFIGLILGGVGIVPMAALATLFKSEWSIFGQVILISALTAASRSFGLYLVYKTDKPPSDAI